MRRFVIVPMVVAAMSLPMLAMAGPTEDAFLAKLAGEWTGTGTVKGSQNGDLACNLTFKKSGDELKYRGRCDVEDLGGRSFSGTLYYNDAEGRYEAKTNSTTNVGVKKGSSVAFTSKVNGINGKGTSTMTISTSKIVIDVDLNGSNGPMKSHVTFRH